jgi:hypothetical protein
LLTLCAHRNKHGLNDWIYEKAQEEKAQEEKKDSK